MPLRDWLIIEHDGNGKIARVKILHSSNWQDYAEEHIDYFVCAVPMRWVKHAIEKQGKKDEV